MMENSTKYNSDCEMECVRKFRLSIKKEYINPEMRGKSVTYSHKIGLFLVVNLQWDWFREITKRLLQREIVVHAISAFYFMSHDAIPTNHVASFKTKVEQLT